MSGPSETEDRSENLTAARRYNRRSHQLQNELQQQLQQQLASMQHLVASLNAMPFLSQNLPFLPPAIPQVATGEMKNSYVCAKRNGNICKCYKKQLQQQVATTIQPFLIFDPMNGNASSAAEALPSMDPSVAQLFLLARMNYNPYYSLGSLSMPQTGANHHPVLVFQKFTLKHYELNFKHYFAFSGCSKRSVLTSWNERI